MAATIPTVTLIAWLDEARTAYHNLTIKGSVRVVVDQNGERIEYTAANSSRLAAYIQQLERQLGYNTSGPVNVWI